MDGNREWKSSYIFFYSKCSFQSITPISSIHKHSPTIFLKLNEVIPARYIIHYTGILFFFFLWKFLLRTSQQRSREWNATWNGSDNSSFLKRNANLSTARLIQYHDFFIRHVRYIFPFLFSHHIMSAVQTVQLNLQKTAAISIATKNPFFLLEVKKQKATFFLLFEGRPSGFSSSKCVSWRKQSVQNFRLRTGTQFAGRYLHEKDSGY